MILDSSAITAIICREPGFEQLLHKVASARTVAIGAPTVAETQMVVTIKTGKEGAMRVDQFLAQVDATIIPFGRPHIAVFHDAFMRYGKGRHPARLNMGDCFTYAIAKVAGLPVLYVGEDFPATDLEAA